MRALVLHAPQDLRIEERAARTPGPGEVAVRVAVGGVCGSDLHYFNHGGFGAVRIREPMILGHEVSGHVTALGDGVDDLDVGDLVGVSPSRPCGVCQYCARGDHNHCLDMRFYGSAMPFPHIQGAFRETLVATRAQCVKADGLSPGAVAMAEPLAVVLHAAGQAGDLLGQRVLVTGSGPIGALAVMVARSAGAAHIVATDLSDAALSFADRAGADRTINVGRDGDALTAYGANKGTFDVHFECSGAEAALHAGLGVVRPRGRIVQLGLGGDMAVPMLQLTAKEIALSGSFRFHAEYATAIALMQAGRIDVTPLITHTEPLENAVAAFEVANDRSQAMKAQIAFA
ncbi:MAG: L-idonate 5-dehydrogenase [Pseudomonadota bacterium]